MVCPGISPVNYESVEYYTMVYLVIFLPKEINKPKEINVLRTYPRGETPYIILLVHCVWTCVKVALSGYYYYYLRMMSMLMLHFVVFVQIHHHHVSNKAFRSKNEPWSHFRHKF